MPLNTLNSAVRIDCEMPNRSVHGKPNKSVGKEGYNQFGLYPTRRIAGLTWRQAPSIQFDGSPQDQRRCRHGNTRRTESRLAKRDLSGTARCLQRQDADQLGHEEKCASAVVRALRPRRSMKQIGRFEPGTQLYSYRQESNGTSGAIQSTDS